MVVIIIIIWGGILNKGNIWGLNEIKQNKTRVSFFNAFYRRSLCRMND